ncbi:MAG: hypothetical protein KatS3mg038_2749 [Candidatus Kapaibacterium sp.]|nr:MAG: hypothetical protein KatS3mg038_2749 [Candidatus Kapabacteria bacterium]
MRPLLLLPLDCAHECLIADDGLRLWPATPPQYTTIGGFGCWRGPRAARRDHAAHGATGAGGVSAAAAERASAIRTLQRAVVRSHDAAVDRARDAVSAARARDPLVGLIIDYTDRADAARLARYYGVAVSVAAPDARVLSLTRECDDRGPRSARGAAARRSLRVRGRAAAQAVVPARSRPHRGATQDTGSVRCLRLMCASSRC